MTDYGIAGKVAVVTGANQGIGAEIARRLAGEGASVFIQYLRLHTDEQEPGATEPGQDMIRHRQAKDAASVLSMIRDAGGRAEAWEADLSGVEASHELFERAEAALGPVQILVNNATHCHPDSFLPDRVGAKDSFGAPLAPVSAAGIDQHFAVNVRAPALLIAEFARRHIERAASSGRIINLSTDGASGFAHMASYGASKYATESYSRAAAQELGRYGITVNVMSPGPTQTGYITRDAEDSLLSRIPLGRLGQTADIADVVAFLASDQARWVTGQVIYVGGGHRM